MQIFKLPLRTFWFQRSDQSYENSFVILAGLVPRNETTCRSTEIALQAHNSKVSRSENEEMVGVLSINCSHFRYPRKAVGVCVLTENAVLNDDHDGTLIVGSLVNMWPLSCTKKWAAFTADWAIIDRAAHIFLACCATYAPLLSK